MDFKIPDKLTFRRSEVIKIAKLDGKVIDYWEKEFGGLTPVINKLGEKFYTKLDVLLILKIKQWMIVERIDKTKIKKMIQEDGLAHEPQKAVPKSHKGKSINTGILKEIKTGLQEILTILEKNGTN